MSKARSTDCQSGSETFTLPIVQGFFALGVMIFVVLFLAREEARAQSTVVTEAPPSNHLGLELGYQVHSLPMGGSSLIGPALTYPVSNRSRVGFRGLISPQDSSDRRAAVFWRLQWSQRYFVWLVEPQVSYLWSRTDNYAATGVAGGFQYRVDDRLFIGAILGMERPGPFFPFGPFWDRPSLILTTTFDF